MDREKLGIQFLKIYFIDNSQLLIDVSDTDNWQKILREKEKIRKIESAEWTWNLMTGEVTFH
jgi:hypothetical protein